MFKNSVSSDAWLVNAYLEERKTMRQIADEAGCSAATILNHLRRLGVETRKLTDYPASQKVIDHCRTLGKSQKGRRLSEETKRKMSESKKTHRMGAKKVRPDGYVSIYYPDYPSSTKEGRVLEHVYVMEQMLGRKLAPNECVHHINHIRTDNRIENLALMTKSEHSRLHTIERNKRRKVKTI